MNTGKRSGNSGSALVATLIIVGVTGIGVCSYIALVNSRERITAHSQAWNSALPVLEAGVEEAFTHYNDDYGNMTTNGWTSVSTNGHIVYQKTRYLTNVVSLTSGTNATLVTNVAYCTVVLSNVTALSASIYSSGFVTDPLTTNYISRNVLVIATNSSMFRHAVSSVGLINLNSGTFDSFNSSDPNYSSNGMYVVSKREGNGSLVTDSTANPAINVRTANIFGTVDTGVGGTVTPSGSGGVGSLTWTTGVQSGYESDDMNATYPDPTVPSPWGPFTPAGGIVGGTNYTVVLNGTTSGAPAQFQLSSLTLSSGPGMVVTGNAILYVVGDVTVQGSAYIYLAPGATLALYTDGSTTTLSGGGVINGNNLASSFSYYGMSGNTSITYSGSTGYTGTIDAPEAAFTLSGSASLTGAVIVNTFTGSGGAGVHFDQALDNNGQLTMTSYTEF